MIAHPASLAKSSIEKFAKKSLIFQHLHHQTSQKQVPHHFSKQNQVVREKLHPKIEKIVIIWKQKALIFKKLALILSPDDFEGVGSHFSVPSLPSSSRLSCPEGKGTKNVLNRAEPVSSASRELSQLGRSPGRFCYC